VLFCSPSCIRYCDEDIGRNQMERRVLTLAQVLAWNENWSARDREKIEAALDEVPDAEYYIPATGGYIGVEIFGSPAAHTPTYNAFGSASSAVDLPPSAHHPSRLPGVAEWHVVQELEPHPVPRHPGRSEVCLRCDPGVHVAPSFYGGEFRATAAAVGSTGGILSEVLSGTTRVRSLRLRSVALLG
jgi:hypothetical protein